MIVTPFAQVGRVDLENVSARIYDVMVILETLFVSYGGFRLNALSKNVVICFSTPYIFKDSLIS